MRYLLPILAGTLLPATLIVAQETEIATAVEPTQDSASAAEEQPAYLGEMVVTAPLMDDPFTVVTDPKTPRQPVPAADGADFLQSIPGFSMIRKGGTSGDPLLRGLGGSRLNILQDGAYTFGGCGMRMDPPTAYVYPESYDKVTVLKGPQSVLYGGGNVAGTVLFERHTPRFTETGTRFVGSALAGSYGRNDLMADFTVGAPMGYARIIGTRAASDNYEDGDGTEIHSEHSRWSGTALLGWTPNDDTRVELNVERSGAEAAYADRTMDGVVFDREGYGLRWEQENISPLISRLELQHYHNYVDHVMDNFSLRTPPAMRMISNPDRETDGGRIAADLALGERTVLTAGLDYRDDEHTKRGASAMGVEPVLGSRLPDMSFDQRGFFAELEHAIATRDRLFLGMRVDQTTATADSAIGGAAAGDEDKDTTRGAFVRHEHSIADSPLRLFAGVGFAERSPDYWERSKTFSVDSERNTQIDLGAAYQTDRLHATLATFYSRIDDYILIDATGSPTVARNVDATLYGFEADSLYSLSPEWTTRATLAYLWGENDTDDTALPQIAPFEVTAGLGYDNRTWSAGVLVRWVADQTRVDPKRGGIAGQDVGETDGFTVTSINPGYRVNDKVRVTAGVDNLFDKTYAEHVSRAGAAITEFETTERVNEPGRLVWMKATVAF